MQFVSNNVHILLPGSLLKQLLKTCENNDRQSPNFVQVGEWVCMIVSVEAHEACDTNPTEKRHMNTALVAHFAALGLELKA